MENPTQNAAKNGRPAQPRPTLPAFMGVAQSRMKMGAGDVDIDRARVARLHQMGSDGGRAAGG